ncbi:helix-turn-helix transcriptional regulator [Bdellovibrio sp.]|uniref:helix-turn-helix domain-containing protein n=1 Tax=Bdellovibrio sp. TaxID=28201 RepID=UPI0032219715
MKLEQVSACVLRSRLRPLMKARGINYKVLGEKSGIPVKTLYGWSAGNSPRHLADVYAVAKVLGVSLEELCFSSGMPEGNRHRFLMQKPEQRILKGIESMNMELSVCLKNAHRKSGRNTVELEVILEGPVLVPCYLLFTVARDLGVAKEIYEIISTYEWEFGQIKSLDGKWSV